MLILPIHSFRRLRRLLPLVLLALSIAVPGLAAVPVAPGEEIELVDVDGGSRTCRRGTEDGGSDFLDCLVGFLGTNAQPDDNFVRARSLAALTLLTFPTALGVPNYATARLFKDIEIVGGPPDTEVPVAISAVFDYKNFFFLGASYVASSSVTLQVVDLSTGLPVATQTLFETSRDGDQGFTDVALADQRLVIPGASADLSVLLRRGRQYRLVFELEVMSQVLAVGIVEADASATWQSITVRVDEDEVEQLADHDSAVRSELAAHDTAVRSELATHDADIKALLAEITRRQEETIRLLLTPQGRRESDLGSFPLKPTPVPAPSGNPIDDLDGVQSADDVCPFTPEGADVDTSGCALEEFCALQDRSRDCVQVDWQGDESESPHDCRWRWGACWPG